MRKKRGIAAFRFLDVPPTSFAGNLGGRSRSEEVTEEDHDRVPRKTCSEERTQCSRATA